MARAASKKPKSPAPPEGGQGGAARIVTQRMRLDELAPAPYNPRTISAGAMKGLSESVRRFGLVQPVIWNKRTGRVVGGHQRVKALESQGVVETDVVVVDLPELEEKALNLALNSPAISWEFSEGALALLEEIHMAMPDVSDALRLPDLQKILRHDFGVEPPAAKDPPVPPVPKTPTSRTGDVWTLGRHRVACGDSRDPSVIASVLGGRMADVLWTDPPYGVAYSSKVGKVHNDEPAGLDALLRDIFAAVDTGLRPGARFYIAAPAGPQGTVFRCRVADVGWKLHQVLVWVKDRFVLGHSDYHYRHEDVLYGWKPGKGRLGRGRHEGTRWYGGNDRDTVFEIPRPATSEEHPTMKPVDLVVQTLRCSATEGDVVLDPCGGSGTTLLAADALGLASCVVEISPGYTDVIVQRWEAATGGKAVRS